MTPDTTAGGRVTLGPRTTTLAKLPMVLPYGTVLVDSDHRGIFANPAAGIITGMPHEEMHGRDFVTYFAEHERAAVFQDLTAAFGTQPITGTATVLWPNDEERRVRYAMHLLVDDRPLVAVTMGDITEEGRLARRAALLAQMASHAAFEESLESKLNKLAAGVVQATGAIACGVCLMDPDNHESKVFGSHGIAKDPEAETCWKDAMQRGARMPGSECVQQRRPFIQMDARTRKLEEAAFAPIHPWLREAAWDAIASLPLIYRGRVVGSLNAFYPRGKSPGEADIPFLTAIADHAAITAEDARLFAEARQKAILEERQRIARELHDSVSQALYGIALGARTARMLLDRDAAQVAEPLDYVLSLAEAGLAEMRALIFELRPETLEAEGLIAALTKQIESARARHGLDVQAEWHGGEPQVTYETKEAVYRIAREALNNVIRHARARRATLRLESRGRQIVMDISDDGIGFSSEDSFPGHLGLRSMRERAEQVGGTLDVESAPSAGTRVRVSIPLAGA
ncbi:MAG: histidine kinase [Armatimonadota bacterium]|nr:histidine kinase [Armatimonadota bacterium]